MKNNADEIYNKIKKLNHDVKETLKTRGLIVPTRQKDGTIKVGLYRIKKEDSGFYSIVNYRNEPIVDAINLPHTAAIIANKLALGRFIDDEILTADRKYGHALFEETLQKQLAEKSLKSKNLDKAELMYTKSSISKAKKEHYKVEIKKGFEKLMRFR